MQHLSGLIEHYGYFGIFIALVGGIVGLPIPDELLLTYVGYNVFQGRMTFFPSLLCSFSGAFCGITLSYVLGIKLGMPFLKRFGPKLHMTEVRIARTKRLFSKFGPFLLLFGYFIPGVRHIVAYLSGINGYHYKKFALFAYLGAFVWCLTFITLGRGLGEHWMLVSTYISKYSIYLVLLFIVGFFFYYTYWRKTRVWEK